MERRTYIRQPIDLAANLVTASRVSHACRLKDFCLGGVFLDFIGRDAGSLTVQVGDNVEISFSSVGLQGMQEFRVNCRVAGLFKGGTGLSFVNPPPETLIALQNFASQSKKPQPAAAVVREPGAGTPEARVLDACRERMLQFQAQQLGEFFAKLENDLFIGARDADSNFKQGEYYDALKEVEQVKEPFTNTFNAKMGEWLRHPGQPVETGTQVQEGTDGVGLSLVDTKEFSDLLSIKKILERVAPTLEDPMYDINKRLSKVTGRDIDDSNNPFGPISLCSALHESLQNLATGNLARRALYKAFETKVLHRLQSLYKDLNEIFVQNGILPVVKKPSFHVPHRSRPSQPPVPAAAQVETAADDAAAMQEAPPGPEPVYPGQAPAPGYATPQPPAGAQMPPPPASPAPQGQEAPANTAYAARAPAPADLAGSPYYPAAPPSAPPADWAPGPYPTNALQAARSLFQLNRGAQTAPVAHNAAGVAGLAAPAPTGATPAYYPAADVLNALSHMQQSQEPHQPGGLEQRLQEKLAEMHGGGETRQLGDAERDAIGIIAGLVRSILNDTMVAGGVKQRMAGMEPPLARLALQDDSFLVNEAHPARQLVNQLGRLDLPLVPKAGSQDEQVCEQVDALVGRVATKYTRDLTVFDEALQELDQIVEQQARIYQKNLEITVSACEQADSIKRKRVGAVPGRASDLHKNVPPEMQQALERVMHLKIGDILGFKGAGEIRREVLAWIAEDKNTYVFVDFKGRKSSTRIAQELAIALQRGSAALLSESELPTMERGLYSVFNDLQQNLARDATLDSLTGMLKAKFFYDRLDETLTKTRMEHTEHCLCVLELDDFERLVERSSESAGDSLIKRLAVVLNKQLAARGYLARLKKSRFAALLADCDKEEGLRVVERLRSSIEQSRVVWKGEALPVSMSAGLVLLNLESQDADTEIAAALAACEQAQAEGGNRARFPAEESAGDVTIQMTDWKAVIPGLLEQGRLHLYSQSMLPVGGGKAKPIREVVVRMEQVNGEIARPAEFIRGAEQAGLMPDVDRWVLLNTLQWMAKNRKGLSAVAGYAIKLTESTLSEQSLLSYIMTAFSDTGVPPGKVLLQVTEATASDKLSTAAGSIDVLREYGSRFCLNNFGSGDSTYAYLKQLPVDYIKIDSLFLEDILSNQQDAAVVRSITEVGHLMQKRIIANHADNAEVCELFESLGIDYMLGPAFGDAVPIDESMDGG